MSLAEFITGNMEAILVEWEAFARTRLPAAASMSNLELRDHARQVLVTIAIDLNTAQSPLEQTAKSRGLTPTLGATGSVEHGALRHRSGFDLPQLVSEYRALRATIIRLWEAQPNPPQLSLNEITRLHESIDQSLAEAVSQYSDEADRSRDTFLAILGHDLRSPLYTIAVSGAYLAKTGTLDGNQVQAVARIQRSATTMSAMIRDLIEFTKVARGTGIPLTVQQANLGEICHAAIDEMQTAHPDRLFQLGLTGDLNGTFDSDRLLQVLSNLLNNAIQHGATDSPVHLSAIGDGVGITIRVSNFGNPIPPEALKVIFNPWVQLANDKSDSEPRRAHSIGLGLFIAREIVEAHKGSIDVESTEQEGTVFTVRLPRGYIERRRIPRGT